MYLCEVELTVNLALKWSKLTLKFEKISGGGPPYPPFVGGGEVWATPRPPPNGKPGYATA